MKKSTVVAVWAGLVVATVLEVAFFELDKGNIDVDLAIGVVASINAVITAMYSMDLRDESTAIKYLFLIPVLLVAVLIITLLVSFPVID